MSSAKIVRRAFMHYCFAAGVSTQNALELQIIPGMSGRIMLVKNS
jgi:hypothetical protein